MNQLRTSIGVMLLVLTASELPAVELYSLYTDHRAMKVDDILTIIIMESAKAGTQSGTDTRKENSAEANATKGTGWLRFLPHFGVKGDANLQFSGKGSTSRQGNLAASISARVIEVLDNGNLVIKGSKIVEINNEKEIIKIEGVVRPQDIESNNMVYSSSIADAIITYTGRGVVSTGRRPGPIARFLNWIF